MTTKHTPGPWKYRQPLYDRMRNEPVRTLEVLKDGANGIYKPYIADVRSLDASGQDNTEANARLIAAAPDLLAALEHIAQWQDAPRECAEDYELGYDSGRAYAANVARAVIAKAKGESK